MSATSNIEWTDATWNPVRGCTKISPGCAHCYAETFAERFRGVPGHPYEQGFDLRLVPEKLAEPLRWATPQMVFVNSMSDLFHEDVPDDYIEQVGRVMRAGELAHLPGADQAVRADARPAPRPAARSPPSCRTSGGASASRTASTACRGSTHLRDAPGGGAVPLGRAAAGRPRRARPDRHRLGDRRRRERARGPADATRTGSRSIRDQCHAAGRAVLLQAVGRRAEGDGRAELDGRTHDDMPPPHAGPVAPHRHRLALIEDVGTWGAGVRPA